MSTENTTVPITPIPEKSLSPTPDKIKMQVKGKELEVPLEELKRAYGLDKTAHEKFNAAAQKMKEVEELKNSLSQKDLKVLQAAGWSEDDIERIAADYLVNLAQKKSMTPQQRAQAERESEYEKLKKEKMDREESEKTKAQKEIESREAQLYQTAFMNELSKSNNKTWLDLEDPIILSHIVNDIRIAADKSGFDLPLMTAIRRLEERLEKRGAPKKEYWKKLSKFGIKDIDDSDLDAFYEKGAKGIREKSLEAIRSGESPFVLPKSDKQTKSTFPTLQSSKRDPDFYKSEAQRYRDLRYGRKK